MRIGFWEWNLAVYKTLRLIVMYLIKEKPEAIEESKKCWRSFREYALYLLTKQKNINIFM